MTNKFDKNRDFNKLLIESETGHKSRGKLFKLFRSNSKNKQVLPPLRVNHPLHT